MKLINEIIEILSSDEGKLSDALIKTKVLLHRIGHKELVEWVNKELNGYSDDGPIPSYRILSAAVLVDATNGEHSFSSHPVPLEHLSEDFRKDLETIKMFQSLAVLEKLVEKDDELTGALPLGVNELLAKGLVSGYTIQRAWKSFNPNDAMQTLIQVRSRLLDFVLELDEDLAGELDEEEVKKRADSLDIVSLFNNAISGGEAAIVAGDSVSQSAGDINIKDDVEVVPDTPTNDAVSDENVSSPTTAIEEDDSSARDTNIEEDLEVVPDIPADDVVSDEDISSPTTVIKEDDVEVVPDTSTNDAASDEDISSPTTVIKEDDSGARDIDIKAALEVLSKALKNNGVSFEDISSLTAAIKDDVSVDFDKEELGPAVNSWKDDMLSKAMDASWHIELGVADDLLATLLQDFYSVSTETKGDDSSARDTDMNGSLEVLSDTLRNNGVSIEDISSLTTAIKYDNSVVDFDKKEFGPAVKDWKEKMLSKVVDASWQIEFGVASDLLTTVLKEFYGW